MAVIIREKKRTRYHVPSISLDACALDNIRLFSNGARDRWKVNDRFGHV